MKKLLIVFLLVTSTLSAQRPRLAIIFVVDQFAHHYLNKIEPHLSGGLHHMIEKGIVYENAYMPHSTPATGPGHVALNTGTFAKNHGIVGNKWFDNEGNKIRYEKDKKYGKSAHNIMVDGISDQLVNASKPHEKRNVFALSYKSRAAIGMAGKLGKAIWFEQKERQFTSSKAYFDQIPSWVAQFNKTHAMPAYPQNITWSLSFPNKSQAYALCNKDYSHAGYNTSLINIPFKTIIKTTPLRKELFGMIPHANQILLDLAQHCLKTNLSKNKKDQMTLWISLSPLDPLGHIYGPDSQEVFDMLYHLDWQLKQFIDFVHTKVSSRELLLVLTADHGVMPIVEQLQRKGLSAAQRINSKTFIKQINNFVEQKFGIEKSIWGYRNSSIYMNKNIFYQLPQTKQIQILADIKIFLEKQPYICKVWTQAELKHQSYHPETTDSFFKNQLYEERSGELICKLHPYITISKHNNGTNHKTPYEYDTHIPLMLYQKKNLEKKKVTQKVFATQLANTLAKILQIPKPSASRSEVLPGV